MMRSLYSDSAFVMSEWQCQSALTIWVLSACALLAIVPFRTYAALSLTICEKGRPRQGQAHAGADAATRAATHQILQPRRERLERRADASRHAPQQQRVEPSRIELVERDAGDGDALGRAGRVAAAAGGGRVDDLGQARGRAREVERLERRERAQDEDRLGRLLVPRVDSVGLDANLGEELVERAQQLRIAHAERLLDEGGGCSKKGGGGEKERFSEPSGGASGRGRSGDALREASLASRSSVRARVVQKMKLGLLSRT